MKRIYGCTALAGLIAEAVLYAVSAMAQPYPPSFSKSTCQGEPDAHSVSSKVPHDNVLKLNADLDTVLKVPELAPRWIELGMTPLGGPPDAAVKRNAAETETWTKVIRAAGIRAD